MDTLPNEIITYILEFLKFEDYNNLKRVNKKFYNILMDDYIYYKKYVDDPYYNNKKSSLEYIKKKNYCPHIKKTEHMFDLYLFLI